MRLLAACAVVLACAAPAFASPAARTVSSIPVLSFVWPAQGTITTPFIPYGHAGIDIGMLRTLTVRAAVAGTVELVGYPVGYSGYGNVIVVRVTPTMETIYAHLASYSVKPGDTVTAGQAIGVAGCTGLCTGTHLHFEVRISGTPVDPMQWLN
ncbi:MAG TPA: M23 family metallopeptidase [Gaiellaceae bacterium]|nr:M23 family metallopeptidase [Gaiellaceae bacterium]